MFKNIMHRFSIIRWLSQKLGIDKAVAYSVAGKIWQIVAGIINILLIAHFISRAEQGYLYTFQSLLALQILFDLSLPSVLIQFAGHEMAHLKWQQNGTVHGNATAKSRLSSLIRISFRWYSYASVLMLFVLSVGGVLFFTSKGVSQNTVNWEPPWLLICLAASTLIILTPLLGIIEGCGKVAEVAAFRITQDSIASAIYWISLMSGLRLFSLPILYFTRMTILLIYLILFRGRFLFDLKSKKSDDTVKFKKEIWPFQWRFLICSISSLLAFYLATPIVFAAQGPIAAGQLGMTLSITTALSSVSIVWISTKTPLFCNLIALKNYEELDRVFSKVSRQSFSVLACLSGGLIIAILAASKFFPVFSLRLADPGSSALLVLAVLMSFPNIAGSFYLRAHKREVTARANLIIALFTVIAIFLASRYKGFFYLGIAICLSSFILSLWVSSLFFRYRKLWHAGNTI
jgi:O-antigen/teichoic acid export membrane protein